MKTKKIKSSVAIVCLILLMVAAIPVLSQNVAITDEDSHTPDEHAMLDIYSLNKGLLIPRVALEDANNPIGGTKQEGLLLWNTNTDGAYSTVGFYFWNGSDWQKVGSGISYQNGLYKVNETVGLGGSLNQSTSIDVGNYTLDFDITGSGSFQVLNDGSAAFYIDNSGNVGINTEMPGEKLELDGNFKLGDNVQIEGTSAYRVYRNLATYASNTKQGAFVINTNQPINVANMFMVKISGYFYSSKGPIALHIKGYHAGSAFYNTGYTSVGPDELQVRVAQNGDGNIAIIIGDEETSYSFPKIIVTHYFSGYATPVDSYADGWVITQETDLSAYSSITEVPNETTVSNYYNKDYIDNLEGDITAEDLWDRSSGKTYLKNSGDNVGFGTSAPQGKLHLVGSTTLGSLVVSPAITTSGYDAELVLSEDHDNTTNMSMRYDGGINRMLFYGKSGSTSYGPHMSIGRIDGNVGIGTGSTAPTSTLTVQGNNSGEIDDPLFEVKNNNGATVFAVYNEGVRIWVDDNSTKAIGSKGGFAVGGISSSKGITNEFLRVTPDSVRVYIDTESDKATGTKGGFAVGGISSSKSTTQLMRLNKTNYYIGHESGLKTTGLYNLFFGFGAGKENLGGNHNTFIGYKSGTENTNGYSNVFIGEEAGNNNELGFKNVFIGYQAAFNNVGDGGGFDGTYNVMVGHKAGYGNISGGGHVIMGYNAATQNTSSNYMTAIGYSAGAGATGGHNVFIGGETGKQFGDGEYNTCVGMSAAAAGNGDYNTYIGAQAGWHNDGSQNVGLGYGAGYGANTYAYSYSTCIGNLSGAALTTGSYNTFVGHSAGRGVTSGTGNVFLGYEAGRYESGSNKLYIENSNSSSPLIWGDFNTDRLRFNANVGIGYSAYTSYGLVVKGGTTNSLRVYKGDGQDYAMYVGGNSQIAGSWSSTSDARYKKNIEEISNSLSQVLKLEPVLFDWKVDEFSELGFSTDKQVGLIAQKTEEVFPMIVQTDKEGYKSIEYAKLNVYLIKAIQEQQEIIEELKSALQFKNTEVEQLKVQVEKIGSIEKQLEIINQQLHLKADYKK